MSRTIILNERQLKSFLDNKGEITIGEFKDSVLKTLGGLLKDPKYNGFDGIFKRFGVDDFASLVTKLRDKGMLHKFERISEEPNKDGKLVSYYHVSYKVPAKDLESKIEKWFDDEINASRKLDECDCGGCLGGTCPAGDGFLGGATNGQSNGEYTVPFNGLMKRPGYDPVRKGKKKRKE